MTKRHPNYKGGTIIASNGYALRYVGKNHHAADVRGYAYEHRLIAEKKLGRPLRKGEIAHHKDEDITNNADKNIEVVKGIAEHKFLHRRKSSRLKKPSEQNKTIECACGCGKTFKKYDKKNRPRTFVSGHNLGNK